MILRRIFSHIIFQAATFSFIAAMQSCTAEEPAPCDCYGTLSVALELDTPEDENPDFSEFSVAIVPKSGFIYSEFVKNINWPVEVRAGKYTIAAASPTISETDSTFTCYYGEKKVEIIKDRHSEVTVSLSLHTYQKNDLDFDFPE